MRVLHLSLGYNSTGADRCARELFEELPRFGVQTELWVGEYSRNLPPGVTYVPRPWERFLFPLEAFPDITDWRHRGSITKLKAINKDRFDVVHMHNVHSGWLSMKALKQLTRRFPCVWTLHDEWAPNRGLTCNLTGKMTPSEVKRLSRGLLRCVPYHRYHDNFKWRRTRRFLAQWIPEPRVVVCPSAYMAGLARSSGVFPNSDIRHIPNGTVMTSAPNARMDRAEAKRSFGLAPEHPVALMVATNLADAHKGMDLAVRALKAVDPAFNMQVLLLGRSAEPIQAALHPIPSVAAFLHDMNSLARAYRAADLTIIPSLAENFPNVGLESLACETPIVGFPIGGMPEMIGENERGRLCKKIDTSEMSSHISQLFENSETRTSIGVKGAGWVRENCEMPRYLRKMIRLYEDLAGEPGTTCTPPL